MLSEPISGRIYLKKKREKPVLNRHPWIFSGAVHHIEGQPRPGELVIIHAADGQALAIAYYNPHSQICARILTWEVDQPMDQSFWLSLMQRAISSRHDLINPRETTAYRLVHGEADGLPGLIVDKYGDYVVMQCLTLGIDQRKEMLAELLAQLLQPRGVIERSDSSMRDKEGLPEQRGLLWGVGPTTAVTVLENDFTFQVDLLEGHKTGFYLDQRDNRALLGQSRFVAGHDVLNVFAYTGGFAVYAAAGGANQIINIDTSFSALELAEQNVHQATGERPQDEYLAGDAFQILRDFRDDGREFDVVILDPPKFAHSQRDIPKATRGYKDINWLALRMIRPGGLLATFSCSGSIDVTLFQKVVFGAAVDANRQVQILYHLWQAADHPISLTFPESAYLKGFLCRVW